MLLLSPTYFPQLARRLDEFPEVSQERKKYSTAWRSPIGWVIDAFDTGKLVIGGSHPRAVIEIVESIQNQWFDSCLGHGGVASRELLAAALKDDDIVVDVESPGRWNARFGDDSALSCDGSSLIATAGDALRWLSLRNASKEPWFATSGTVCSAIPESEHLRDLGRQFETKDLIRGAEGLFKRIVQSKRYRSLDTRVDSSGDALAAWLRSVVADASRLSISYSDNTLRAMQSRGLALNPCQDPTFRITHALSSFLETST
jgi:hypothetical protein